MAVKKTAELEHKTLYRDQSKKKHDKWFFEDFFIISDLHIGLKLGSEEWIENMRNYFENFFIPLVK